MSTLVAQICLTEPSGTEISTVVSLASREIAYVVAPNGCGKTRAAKRLCGLEHGRQNSSAAPGDTLSVWDGKSLAALDLKTRAAIFAFVPSNPRLVFSMIGRTLRQEFELAFAVLDRDVDNDRINQVSRWFGVESLLERDYRFFSGGELMRAAISCALVKRPMVVITDQLVDQIDPESRVDIATALANWCRDEGGIMLHFASALPEFGCHSDRCVFLTGGEFVSGTLQECWPRLGAHRANLLSGPMRLAAVLEEEAITAFDSMPCNPSDVASALPPRNERSEPAAAPASGTEGDGVIVSIREFTYPGGSFHLQDVSLRIPAKKLCGLLGPNGAGKTTLLKCVGNLVGPWQGFVSVRGQQYDSSLALPKTARAAVYCFQNPDDQLYRATVADELVEYARNITGAGRALSSEALQIADTFGLTAHLHASPFDLPLPLRRLLLIGSCLVARPPLILLDEPTVWLDAWQKGALKAALSRYLELGGCALAVSHDLDWISGIASNMIYLTGGRIIDRVVAPVLSHGQSLPFSPTCLQVAEQVKEFPRFWREEDFIQYLRHE